ncbi:MAG: Molybdopterin synthase sulfur carrier subunit [Alphaproteobacteria bacterium MarineAlpha11_Bin1]|nr:MAG: Molybdopterin synthase sulfur carrier subunit [Alphaproteobacteria bacterium MarineAlpha11_Bin1]|tara:strand:- start:2002 stop:2253 length:252 start_codon:yes stop_codon:yes gene_type:complete
MQILYFGWVRSRIGHDTETLQLPANIETVADLIEWLKLRGKGYAYAFEDSGAIRAAVNHEIVPPDTLVRNEDEVALFPPMTGG